jgi:hypothetical protein
MDTPKKMKQLTPKQQSYVDQRIVGLDPSPAYRASDFKSDVMSAKAISVEAAKLEKNPSVALAIKIAREKASERVGLTLESHLSRLEALSLAAEQEAQFGAAITAETNRGKASGLYVERVEQSGPDGGPIEVATVFNFIPVGNSDKK